MYVSLINLQQVPYEETALIVGCNWEKCNFASLNFELKNLDGGVTLRFIVGSQFIEVGVDLLWGMTVRKLRIKLQDSFEPFADDLLWQEFRYPFPYPVCIFLNHSTL